jgi:hypothetical protein
MYGQGSCCQIPTFAKGLLSPSEGQWRQRGPLVVLIPRGVNEDDIEPGLQGPGKVKRCRQGHSQEAGEQLSANASREFLWLSLILGTAGQALQCLNVSLISEKAFAAKYKAGWGL